MSWFHKQGDEELGHLAARVFTWGLRDGRKLSKPRSADDVMSGITAFQDQWRVIDKKKMRQVYGAGYDLGRFADKEPQS